MRDACRVAAEVLDEAVRATVAGRSTDDIDAVAHEACIRRGAYPSTLGYHGYPKSICTSVNEVILHGIPDDRRLVEGDIVTVDVTVYFHGMHGDCSRTVAIGEIDDESQRLVEATVACLGLGIEAVAPGKPLHSIGLAIETYARERGLGVVRDFRGHGIGERFHAAPQVKHFYDPSDTEALHEGMTFTVEPMLTAGSYRHVMWDDGWTVATEDGSRAAQFEHTILVTAAGAEILTR
jgi:methionyl aminopeptidase